MIDTYDFKPETIKVIMAGLKPEIRLNQSGKQQIYMVPLDNASAEQITEAAKALNTLVETSLYTQGKKYNNNMPAVEAFNAMGQPTMYRGTDAEAIRMIDNIADVMQEEQTKQDMDIIRSVYTPVINGDNIQFKMLERYQVNRENIEQAVKLLDQHFGVKINDPQENVPLMAKAYRHVELDVPTEYAKYAIQIMTAQEKTREETETEEKIEDKPQLISKEREAELNKAYEEWQAQRIEQIKQLAGAYEVSYTERDGTYFRPKEGASPKELAAGEQALRALTDEKMKDKRFYIPNAIISMGAMNEPKMFRATNQKIGDTEKVKEIFAEIGEEVKNVVLPQTQKKEKTQEETETIDMSGLTNTISELGEAEPIVQQITPQSNETKMLATNEEKAIKYTLQTAANLEKNFIIVAGNLEAHPWVLPEQIEDIKKQAAPLLETKDIIKDGRVIGLEPTSPDQADAMFQMMEAAKATRGILETYPEMAKNPQDVLKLFADNLETIQKMAKENKKADNAVETVAPSQTEEVFNGTTVNRTFEPQLLTDLNDSQSAEPAQEELPPMPLAQMVEMYTALNSAEQTPETEHKKEALGKQMDKFVADYVAGEVVINQDNIADSYDDMKKLVDLYEPEDKNASIARERLEKEIALYDKNNQLDDIVPEDEKYLANRLEVVKEALKGVELDTYYTNLRFFDNDKKEVPQLNENGEVRADSELAKLFNIVKTNILTEATLEKGSVNSEDIAKRANELLQINTVALIAADLKRTGKNPTTAPEHLEGLKNGQTFMMPQDTMAGFTATNINRQVARLNRLGTKLNNNSGVVQQLYEPIKTIDPLSAERFGKQSEKTNLAKACLTKFGLGAMAGALATGAGLGAVTLALPAAPVVAGIMAAYTAGHMWIQRKRETAKAKAEGKEVSSLKGFFKKASIRALLTGASIGAIAMGLPAVALGIGAAAAAVGFKGIFKRNQAEGYDVKTSILRSVPESVAGIAGAMLTGGLIHGTTMESAGQEQAVIETTDTTAETVQTVEEQTSANQNPTPTGTDTAPSGTDTETSTETIDSGETSISTTVEEPVKQETEDQTPIHETITLEEVAQVQGIEENIINRPMTLADPYAETPAFDMTNNRPITLQGQEPTMEPIDFNSNKPTTITEDMLKETLSQERPTEAPSNITEEQREALIDDDLAEELSIEDKVEAIARERGEEIPPREDEIGMPSIEYKDWMENIIKQEGNEALAQEYYNSFLDNSLFPDDDYAEEVENTQDPSTIATNNTIMEVDPETEAVYLETQAPNYASGNEITTHSTELSTNTENGNYEEAVPMSETSNNPAITYDIKVQTVVLDNAQVHHTYDSSAHELAQARLNGEGLYDAQSRPTVPDYTPEQLNNALNQIRSLEGTHSELTGVNGTSNADILMYKLNQFDKLVASDTDLVIDGNRTSVAEAFGIKLADGRIYTPADLRADLLIDSPSYSITPDQMAQMLGKIETAVDTTGHFTHDIVGLNEAKLASFRPGADAGFTVTAVPPQAAETPTPAVETLAPTVEQPDTTVVEQPAPTAAEQPAQTAEPTPATEQPTQTAEATPTPASTAVEQPAQTAEPTPATEQPIQTAELTPTPAPTAVKQPAQTTEATPATEQPTQTAEPTPTPAAAEQPAQTAAENKPFVPFTPYEKNEEKDKEQGENTTPQTPAVATTTVEPMVETPAPVVATPTVEQPAPMAGIPAPAVETATPAVATPTPETPAVGNTIAETSAVENTTPQTPMGAHFSFGDAVQTSSMADSGFTIPNSTDNVFTFNMSKPENNADVRPDKEPAQPTEPSQEQLLGQYNNLRIELAKLEQQLIAMGVVLTPEAGQAPQHKEDENIPPLPNNGGKEIIFTGPQLEGKEAVAIGNQGIAGLIIGRKTVTFKRNGKTKNGKANGDTFSMIDENGNIIGRTHSGNETQKTYSKYYTNETAEKNKEMRKFLKKAEENGDTVQMEIFAIQIEGRKCVAYIDGTGQPIGREGAKGDWEKALENTKNISNDDKTIATPLEKTAEEAVVVPPVVPQAQEETVAMPIVPPMQEETTEVAKASTLTAEEQKEINNIINPVQSPNTIEENIKKDMLQSAGVDNTSKGGARNILVGLSKLSFLQKGKTNDIVTPKKDTQDKQPFYKNILTKKGNNH